MDSLEPFRIANSGWIGAQFVPRFDVVRTLLQVLIGEVQAPPLPLSRSALREYHNAYVVYTLLFQGLSTSLRAISNPTGLVVARERALEVFQREVPDAALLLAGLSDKDSGFHSRARLADLSGTLDSQLGNFERHTTALIQRLGLYHEVERCPGDMRRLFALDAACKPITVTR